VWSQREAAYHHELDLVAPERHEQLTGAQPPRRATESAV
jgi:hypothetical protein